MIIPIIVAYITAWLLGMYFVYRHWVNTPLDTWPEKRRDSPAIRASTDWNLSRNSWCAFPELLSFYSLAVVVRGRVRCGSC